MNPSMGGIAVARVNGPITIDGTEVLIGAAEPFPKWLGEIDPNLEIDYSRSSSSANARLLVIVGVDSG